MHVYSQPLVTERLPCKTPGCAGMILPATAERTGGYCMPCVNAKGRQERLRYEEQNRVEVDRFRGVVDPVEHILLLHDEPRYDPLRVQKPSPRSASELYGALDEVARQRLLSSVRSTPERLRIVAQHLAHFSSLPLGSVQRAMLQAGLVYPGYVFRAAPDGVVRALMDRLHDGDDLTRNHVLVALAWSRNTLAIQAFRMWAEHPPSWSEQLHVPVSDFTLEAGWELSRGEPRCLFSQRCEALVLDETGEVAVCAPQSGRDCPHCGSAPVVLLPEIVTCPYCVNTAVVFAHAAFDRDGWVAKGSQKVIKPEEAELPQRRARRGPRRSAYAAVDWCFASALSQLGGHPSWINDAAYPLCPVCSSRMPFVAQLALEDLEDHGEGILYAFRCDACGIVATSYDQS